MPPKIHKAGTYPMFFCGTLFQDRFWNVGQDLSNFKSTALRGSLEVGTMMVFKGYEAQVRGCEVQVRWCSEDSEVVR